MDTDRLQYIWVIQHLCFPAVNCYIVTVAEIKEIKNKHKHYTLCSLTMLFAFSIFNGSTCAAAWDTRATFSNTVTLANLLRKILTLCCISNLCYPLMSLNLQGIYANCAWKKLNNNKWNKQKLLVVGLTWRVGKFFSMSPQLRSHTWSWDLS